MTKILSIVATSNNFKSSFYSKDPTYKHKPINVDDIKFIAKAMEHLELKVDDVIKLFEETQKQDRGPAKMKYRLTICPAFEKDSSAIKEFKFETKAEMFAAGNCAADLLLFLQDNLGVMVDYSNSFDYQKLINDEWKEIGEI